MKKIKSILTTFAFLGCVFSLNAEIKVIDFEDVSFSGSYMPTPSSMGSTVWTSGIASFGLDHPYGASYWEGWKASAQTNRTPASYTNDCAANSGSGANGSAQYAVLYAGMPWSGAPTETYSYSIDFSGGVYLQSIDMSMNSYLYDWINLGGMYLPTGGITALADGVEVYFALRVRGILEDGSYTDYQDIVLASKDSDNNIYVFTSGWETIDFTALANGEAIKGLDMYFQGEQDAFWNSGGLTAPAYICIDNIVYSTNPIPEPSTYAAIFGLVAIAFAIYRKRARK